MDCLVQGRDCHDCFRFIVCVLTLFLWPGIFGYIVSLLLDPETGNQLLFPFLDLLGVREAPPLNARTQFRFAQIAFHFHPDHDQVDQEDRDFFILTFLPAIRSVEQISLLCSLLIVLADS